MKQIILYIRFINNTSFTFSSISMLT